MGRVVCLADVESWRSEHAVQTDQGDVKDEAEGVGEGEEGAVAKVDKGKKPLRGPFVPTVEEVHEAFDWVKAIRYNQPLHLGGKYRVGLRERESSNPGDLSHLLLTPFPSGHTLGGTLFKIRSPTSGTVLYAVGVNHTGERHLDGMVGGELESRRAREARESNDRSRGRFWIRRRDLATGSADRRRRSQSDSQRKTKGSRDRSFR